MMLTLSTNISGLYKVFSSLITRWSFSFVDSGRMSSLFVCSAFLSWLLSLPDGIAVCVISVASPFSQLILGLTRMATGLRLGALIIYHPLLSGTSLCWSTAHSLSEKHMCGKSCKSLAMPGVRKLGTELADFSSCRYF